VKGIIGALIRRVWTARETFAIGEGEAADFDRLRASPAVEILRSATESAATDLFEGRPPRVELSKVQVWALLILFMKTEPLPVAASRVSALGDRLGFIENAFDDLGDLETLILARFAPVIDDGSIWTRLTRRFRSQRDWRGVGPVGAEFVGSAVAQAAFTDPRLHRACSIGLQKMLKGRILMQPGEALLNIRLSAPFFWCLLAIAIGRRGGEEDSEHERVARDAILGEAQRAARTAGWAGFWEQWCLKLALAGDSPVEAKPLVRILENLPLIRGGEAVGATGRLEAWEEAVSTTDKEDEAATMTRPDWMEDAPPFAARLIGGGL
jgi:hypothetical protein